MARSALPWCRFVEENLLVFHLLYVRVALSAAYINVNAFQLEERSRVVIKDGRLPFVRVVATRAADHLSVFDKLGGVRIGVTAFAVVRGGLEVDVNHADFQVLRLVAINAGHGAMRAEKFEPGGRVIKFRDISPRRNGVACRTAKRAAAAVQLCHARCELAAMRVLMTTSAGQVFPAISDGVGQIGIHPLAMTIDADDCNVCSSKREACFSMTRKRKRGRTEPLYGVARFTAIEQWRALELARMHITMTIGASGKLDLE